MKISIIVEGKTEKAFIPYLRHFLENRLAGDMPGWMFFHTTAASPKRTN